MGKTKRKDTRGMDLKPLAVWVPKHVSGLTLTDLSATNMHLAELGWSEHEYYMAFVPYLTDRVPELSQDDITGIQNTYNKVEEKSETLANTECSQSKLIYSRYS